MEGTGFSSLFLFRKFPGQAKAFATNYNYRFQCTSVQGFSWVVSVFMFVSHPFVRIHTLISLNLKREATNECQENTAHHHQLSNYTLHSILKDTP